jgi:hypothetical protein
MSISASLSSCSLSDLRLRAPTDSLAPFSAVLPRLSSLASLSVFCGIDDQEEFVSFWAALASSTVEAMTFEFRLHPQMFNFLVESGLRSASRLRRLTLEGGELDDGIFLYFSCFDGLIEALKTSALRQLIVAESAFIVDDLKACLKTLPQSQLTYLSLPKCFLSNGDPDDGDFDENAYENQPSVLRRLEPEMTWPVLLPHISDRFCLINLTVGND